MIVIKSSKFESQEGEWVARGISLMVVLAIAQEPVVFEFQVLKCSSPQNGNLDGVGHSQIFNQEERTSSARWTEGTHT